MARASSIVWQGGVVKYGKGKQYCDPIPYYTGVYCTNNVVHCIANNGVNPIANYGVNWIANKIVRLYNPNLIAKEVLHCNKNKQQ